MAFELRYPNLEPRSDLEFRLKSYLYQLVDQLQAALIDMDKRLDETKRETKELSQKIADFGKLTESVGKLNLLGNLTKESGKYDTGIGIWHYEKQVNGTYRMYGSFEVTPTVSLLSNTIYYTDPISIPSPFKISSACLSGTASGCKWLSDGGVTDDHRGIVLRVIGDGNFDITSPIAVSLTVIGNYE